MDAPRSAGLSLYAQLVNAFKIVLLIFYASLVISAVILLVFLARRKAEKRSKYAKHFALCALLATCNTGMDCFSVVSNQSYSAFYLGFDSSHCILPQNSTPHVLANVHGSSARATLLSGVLAVVFAVVGVIYANTSGER